MMIRWRSDDCDMRINEHLGLGMVGIHDTPGLLAYGVNAIRN